MAGDGGGKFLALKLGGDVQKLELGRDRVKGKHASVAIQK